MALQERAVHKEHVMSTALMVIAPSVFRDEEYAEPKAILESRGVTVVTASTAPGECIGKLGMRATATLSVADAAEKSWDAVVFVGGAGASVFFDDENAHALASHQVERGDVLAAICVAPSTLARAGLLQGVKATAFPSQEDDLKAHGAEWTGQPVSVDGLIVTGNGPEAATAFGEAVAEVLGV
jgi:protease I